ncbi:MAG: glycine betaine/L-proline ABC transporter substrate-binding protein ProX [Cyanobacteriota bacterium]|nr:glycine betaine/L-proline ABC transporter substrate-binding protein ProX [Cyanobacteriota bacterium]
MEIILNPFEFYTIPLDDWISTWIKFVVDNFRPVFQAIRQPVSWLLEGMGQLLVSIPPSIAIIIIGLIAWQLAGRGVAIYSILATIAIGLVGAWEPAMLSLSLVLTAVVFSVLVGLPLGIACAKSERVERFINPVLDIMQTMPTFVYLVPVVMLFGIGEVPGAIATIIYATPPLIRLTNLGLRQVPSEAVEAGKAFGSTPLQLLWEVELPLAMPAILTGLNQTILFALGMSVIAAMIAVPGLGLMVLQGVGRNDVGLGTVGGLGIVLIAVMLDRIIQAVGKASGKVSWKQRGPIGWIGSWFSPKKGAAIATLAIFFGMGAIAYQQMPPPPTGAYFISEDATPEKALPVKGRKVRPAIGVTEDSMFLSEILSLGLEKLGYQVAKPKQLEPITAYLTVSNGDADFFPTAWEKQESELFEKSGGDEKLEKVGILVSNGLQGYQIDLKTAREYNISNIEQLTNPEIAKIFDTDGDGKANLIGCNAGWTCQEAIEHHVDLYGLGDTVEIQQGSYSTLMADGIKRYGQGQPILYYTWVPHWLASVLEVGKDVVWLEVPEDAETTDLEGINLGFPKDTIRVLASRKFAEANPTAQSFFELVKVPIEDINTEQKLVMRGEGKMEDIRRHALNWVEENRDLFDGWLREAISN